MSNEGYSIVAVCTYNYKDAFDFVIESYLQSDAEKIYIYTDDKRWTSEDERVEIVDFFSKSDNWVVNVGRKSKAVDHFMNNYSCENFVLLDVDCYIIQDIGEIFEKDFDVAISRINKGQMLSSGVVFVKNNATSKKFIKSWIEKQNLLFANKKFVKKNRGAYDQKSLHSVTYRVMKDKTVKILPISYTEYSFKVKDLDKFKIDYKKKYSPKEMKKRIATYNKKQKAAVKDNDIKILHFYNNSYRNIKTVKNIFKLLGREI